MYLKLTNMLKDCGIEIKIVPSISTNNPVINTDIVKDNKNYTLLNNEFYTCLGLKDKVPNTTPSTVSSIPSFINLTNTQFTYDPTSPTFQLNEVDTNGNIISDLDNSITSTEYDMLFKYYLTKNRIYNSQYNKPITLRFTWKGWVTSGGPDANQAAIEFNKVLEWNGIKGIINNDNTVDFTLGNVKDYLPYYSNRTISSFYPVLYHTPVGRTDASYKIYVDGELTLDTAHLPDKYPLGTDTNKIKIYYDSSERWFIQNVSDNKILVEIKIENIDEGDYQFKDWFIKSYMGSSYNPANYSYNNIYPSDIDLQIENPQSVFPEQIPFYGKDVLNQSIGFVLQPAKNYISCTLSDNPIKQVYVNLYVTGVGTLDPLTSISKITLIDNFDNNIAYPVILDLQTLSRTIQYDSTQDCGTVLGINFTLKSYSFGDGFGLNLIITNTTPDTSRRVKIETTTTFNLNDPDINSFAPSGFDPNKPFTSTSIYCLGNKQVDTSNV